MQCQELGAVWIPDSSALAWWVDYMSLLSFPESVTISGSHACCVFMDCLSSPLFALCPHPAALEIPPQLRPALWTWMSWKSSFRQRLSQLKIHISGFSLPLSQLLSGPDIAFFFSTGFWPAWNFILDLHDMR